MAPNSERTERIQLKLSIEVLACVDDFRFAQRLPSRAAAIRELLRRGLEVTNDEERVPVSDVTNPKSDGPNG
jgi:metal-responsive CopG/Arc/MetJ family transcriptional regulator